MKIIRNEELATWTLVPVEVGEEQILTSIILLLKPGDKLSYGGRERDGEDKKFFIIHFHVGAEEKKIEEVEGNVTIARTVFEGGVELILRGSTEEDKKEIWSIRDSCYHYSGDPIFLGEAEIDGKKAIVLTGGRCKFCGAGLLDTGWCTCDACAAKCEHNYVRGAIHGGGTDIGVGEFCDICGRGKPRPEGERKKSIIEHHLEVEKELGISVIHGKTHLTTQEVVNLKRFARRYEKSLQRRV